jgi:2-amino-4-hydroxy-6-hydroxymethyldihydropteridine diphosphokinase
MLKTAYIGIGSNLGDKLDNCLRAIDRVNGIPSSRVSTQSDFYRTSPVGVTGQDWYVNGVVALSTEITAQHLLRCLLSIEADMGRERRRKWDSRSIDLDILLFGDDILDEENLRVPHPMMHLRRFVLVPLISLAPHLVHPVLRKPLIELLNNLSDESQAVIPLEAA